jgi:hypothetical protein
LRFGHTINVFNDFFLLGALFFALNGAKRGLGGVNIGSFGFTIDKNIACGNLLERYLL